MPEFWVAVSGKIMEEHIGHDEEQGGKKYGKQRIPLERKGEQHADQ